MNKIFKHKRGASGLKVVCEFAKSHCSSGEKTAVSSGAHVSTRSGFKSLSIALISALTLGITTPAVAVTFGEAGNRGGSSATGSGAVAGGNNARATAPGSTAIGVHVTASGGNSTAIGMNAESMTGQALAVGSYARARGDQSTAIGNDVTSIGASSIAIGNDDISSVYNNNPLFTAEELAKKDIVDELNKLCAVASCESMYGFKKVGNSYTIVDEDKYNKWSPTFTTGAGAIAIGSRTVAMSDGATAIGTLAVAAGKKSAALGSFSKATAENALAFGAESIASGRNSSVFGIGAKASKDNSMAIGTGAVSNIENSIALGVNSKTDYTGSNKRGYMPGNGYMLPMVSSAGVISVGSATQPRRIVNLASGALDTDAVNVAQLKSLAENLGVDDIADNTDKTMRYLSVSRSTGSAADIQNLIQKEKDFKTYSQYRKYHDIMVLGKNRTGTTDYDNEINELATKISNMEGKYNGFHDAITTPAGLTGISPTSSEQDVKTVTDSINAYTTTILTAAEKTKIKSHNAANEGATGADAIAIGYDAQSTGAQAVSLGKTATASGTDAIAIGNGATAKNLNTIAIGKDTKADGVNTINIGSKVNAASKKNVIVTGFENNIDGGIDHSVIVGSRIGANQGNTDGKLNQNVIIGDNMTINNTEQATIIGSDITATNSKGGIAIGGDDADLVSNFARTEIQGKGAIAIGVSAKAMADAAMSLGVNSQTTVAQGVALGFNSLANTDKGVVGLEFDTATNTLKASSKDNKIWKSTAAALSIGSDTITRQITNVAAGSENTDAVNVAQLKSVSDAISFNVKGKNSAGNDTTTNSIKSGKTVEFASDKDYLKIKHTTDNDGSKFTFDIDQNALKTAIGATSGGNYSLGFIDDAGIKITRDQANQELKIKGGATATNLSTNNIGVEADTTTGTLNIKLAKALKGLTSAEFKNTDGDTTTITGDKITINPNGNTDPDKKVSLNKDGLNNGGNKITNIANGTADGDAVNKKQAETIADNAINKALAPDALQNKIAAGTNIANIAEKDGKLTINAKGATVAAATDGVVKVTSSSEADNVTKYTVDLDDATKNKIDNAANASANATTAMQTLNVKAGTKTAALDKTNNTLEFAAGKNLKVELNEANRKVTYSLADDLKFDTIKTDTINAGKDGSDGTPGKNGTVTVSGSGNADEKGKVVINGQDGSIGLTGKDGTNGITIRGDKGADGVDGANGTNGITRIIYKDANNKDHQVATLDDGIKFVGNNGDKALKLNKQFTIQGADVNKDTAGSTDKWNTFDKGANIMTLAENDGTENGKLTIALAKALKGLTSAEFKNTDGDTTTITGDKITINPNGNTDPDKKVSLNKDGLNNGGNKITNIANGTADGDAVNKKQAETIADNAINKALAPDALQNKIAAGTNIANIAEKDGKLTINAKGATVAAATDGVVKVTSSSEADNVTKYTVDLDDATKNKIDNAANASANATTAMQTLNVKAGTNTAALNKTNDTLEFAAGDNLKVELDQANRKVTYKLADNLKFDNISSGEKADAATGKAGADGKVGVNGKDGSGVAIDGKDGTIVAHGENGENGKSVVINGKDGTIGAKGADGADGVVINGDEHTIIAKGENGKDGVTINGKDGTIGLPGKDGTSANGVVIKSGDVVNGVDGTNGITRIVYTDKNGDHQVATLDDGIKFVGNNGDKALKLNKQFTIQGADVNKDTAGSTDKWNTFDKGANIMTLAENDGTENGKLTIALAKALKGLTSAEFKNTAGDTTTVNGDGVSYNKADNLNPDGSAIEPKKTVSIGKDGINAGGKTISNVGEAKNANDAVNMKQMNETIKTAIAKNNANTELKFAGDFGETKAKDGKITIAGGQTDDKKLSDKPNIGVVAKDGELNIKLAKDIEVDSVTAKNKITVGEGANKITIADGKITGITSAVDPNGNLAKTLADIDNDKGKTAAEKATKKKEAIQKVLENVDIGSVATVGDLKNVTNGLDSVVENVTNITKNVTSITNNVNNITNITNMVANSGDKETIDKAAKAIDGYKKDPNDKNKQKAAENAIKANKIKTYNPYETTVKNNTTIVEAIQNMNERGIKFIHVSDSDKVGEGDDVTLVSDDSRANKIGSIGIGMNAASTAENAIATGTKSEASGADSIATGTDSKASGANAIAMGTGAQAMGENTISIGKGNKVIGKNSGAIGDPTTLKNVNGVYSMGNDNFIQGGGEAAAADKTARDIFAIGNNIGSDTKKVTDKANGSVILGSNGYSNVENGVALGYGSNADRQALKSDDEKKSVYNGNDEGVRNTIKGNYGAVSVGNSNATRQIINVAAGSADSDAVNVAQLKAVTSKIMASTGGVSMSNFTIDPKTGKKVTIADDNRANYAPKVRDTGVNSVAIGANSVANRANTVSVGSAGNERIIANVADGVAPTDAANMRQLQSVANMVGEVKKDAMAGTASAMAIGNLPQATIPGKGMMAIGAGYYKGQTATALGVSKMSENGRWVFKASASYDSQRNVGAAGAIGFHF